MNVVPPDEAPADFVAALEARSARLRGFASRLVFFETAGSTSDEADRLAAAGAAHGTVVVAGAQRGGRGRMGRQWFSPAGAGLYVSVVLRPEAMRNPAEAGSHEDGAEPGEEGTGSREGAATRVRGGVADSSSVTLTAGVALAEAVRAVTGLPADIKWPNDLVIGRRKVCGILAEASSTAGEVRHIVLGFGINVRPAAYPAEIADRATSLESELGRPVERAEVLAESLARLAEHLADISGPGFERMLQRWRELSPSSAGAPVEIVQPGNTWISGTTAGIDADGALLVSAGGAIRRVIAGEIRWR